MTEHPRRGLFVTGTDTDVGKTWVSLQLLKTLKKQRPDELALLCARKPVASGARHTPYGLWTDDTLALAKITGEPLEHVTAYTFEPPISPAEAARQAGCDTPLKKLIKACHAQAGSWTLVEGAGGFYSPLGSDGSLNADLAEALQLPILLVVGHKLGCINHTLLTIEAIKKRGLRLIGVVLNDGPQPVENSSTPHELKRYLNAVPLWRCRPGHMSTGLIEGLQQQGLFSPVSR